MISENIVATSIGVPVATNREAVIGFLTDNLILVSNNISAEKLIDTMIDAFANNPELYKKYVQTNINNSTSFSNVVGDTSSDGGGFGFNMGSVTSLIGSGVSLFATIKGSEAMRDAAKAQANAAYAAAQAQAGSNATALEIAKLQLAAAMQKTTGSNTFLYIGLGVGAIALVGTLIYFIAKKK